MRTNDFNETAFNMDTNPSQFSKVGNMVLQNSRTNLNSINDNLRQNIDMYKDMINREREIQDQMQEQENLNYDKRKMDELKNTIFYDPEDNEKNCRANKIYSNATKIVFAGTGTVNDEKEIENLRKMQQSMVHHQMLARQIEEKKMRKEAEKRKEEEEERIARLANERIQRRLAKSDETKNKEVNDKILNEMENLNTNNLTINLPQNRANTSINPNLTTQRINQINFANLNNQMSMQNANFNSNSTMSNQTQVMQEQMQPLDTQSFSLINQQRAMQNQQQIYDNQMQPPQNYQSMQFSNTIPNMPQYNRPRPPNMMENQQREFYDYSFEPNQNTMPHMDHFKRKEVFDDKFYIDDLVKEIRERLSSEIKFELGKFHEEMINSTNTLKKGISNLRDMALKVSSEKNHIDNQVKGLRNQVLNLHYEDELRTNELMKALASEDNYKILPSDTFYRDSSGKIKDVNKIDDDYIQMMDYLANGTTNVNLKQQRKFIPLADYDDIYSNDGLGKSDDDYEYLLNYNKLMNNYYNF